MSTVLGLVEHDAGTPAETSLEMLTLAREFVDADDSLAVAVFGTDADGIADELDTYGVDVIYQVSHDQLDRYAPDGWARSLGQLMDEIDPNAVVGPGTDRGQEVLARVGAEHDLPMAANCVEIDAEDPEKITRQRWGGSLIEHARIEAPTTLLTVANHELPIEPVADAIDPTVESFEPTIEEADTVVQVERVEESDIEGVPLGEARVVVGGGRGVGDPEGFGKLEELADLLGGTVGSSRAAVNEGWRPHDDQIGLTGTKISPDLYIACGISGAVQHMVGCKGSDNILAINTDPEAAIIQKSEYAVIGDLHEVIPELNDALRER